MERPLPDDTLCHTEFSDKAMSIRGIGVTPTRGTRTRPELYGRLIRGNPLANSCHSTLKNWVLFMGLVLLLSSRELKNDWLL